MPKHTDLIGQRFGQLVVESVERKAHVNFAHCRCDCGTCKVMRVGNLRSGHTRSCGCLRIVHGESLRKDLTGQRFGRLTVIAFSHVGEGRNAYWDCLCDCGVTKRIRTDHLNAGATQSCGCWQKEQTGLAKRQDVRGQRFGRLVIQEQTWKGGVCYVQCLCDCGTMKEMHLNGLQEGRVQSCRCLQKERRVQTGKARLMDLTGQRFGVLVVEGMEQHGRRWYARCRDDGGRTTRVSSTVLRTTEGQRVLQRLYAKNRRARKLGLPVHFERFHELFMLAFWNSRCAVCGATEDFWHRIALDHWIPLTSPSCPGTVPGNMLPLCHARKGAGTLTGPPACNNAKNNQEPVAWLMERLGTRKGTAKLREIERYFEAALAHHESAR